MISLDKKENVFTEKEIFGQPELWDTVYKMLVGQKEDIGEFLEPILEKNDLRIILTGAGSSAFIGEAAQSLIERKTGKITQSIPNTDLTTHSELFSSMEKPILLVSIARSGNSPESMEVFSLAQRLCKEVYHLIITCDKNGKLANSVSRTAEACHKIILPEEANDKSLAMTGSFTSMLLCLLLVWDIKRIETHKEAVKSMIRLGEQVLKTSDIFKNLASETFERVVFLGSGPMQGIARECHLKLQELTDGKIICKFDSFLGLRHGPRAVINKKTLMVYLFSGDPHVFKYERDLTMDISKDPRQIKSISFSGQRKLGLGHSVSICEGIEIDTDLAIVPAALVGQLLGLYKSLDMGLNPDNPSTDGAISRVVQGVKIYKR